MRRRTLFPLNCLVGLGLVFLLSRISSAQSPQPDRVAAPIVGSPAVWLEGNVRPVFQPANDIGPAEGSLALNDLALSFKLTSTQQADLTELLAEQQDPSSPNYHRWLAPEQYADRFGLSPHDLGKIITWLQSQGFTIRRTARGRTWVSFSGTAAEVQAAFQTEIHYYSLHGQTYYANASEPAVPAALADVVLGIRGLDNYRLKPRIRVRHVQAEPNFTSAISGNTFVAPGDFAVIYDVKSLYDAGIDGTGQTIAVMGQTDLYNGGSDITDFRNAAGLTGGSLTLELDPNSSDPGLSDGDIQEASLDVEWAGAVARNAKIIFFYSTNIINHSLYDAIDQDLAPVISLSYGNCEADWGSTALSTLAQNAQRANSQGQTIVAAAGDSGAADCDVAPANSTTPITIAKLGLAVDAPASVPYVTGMGGGEFNEGSGAYWKSATSSTGDIVTSALSYIPEMAWNDTASSLNPQHELLAGGGGASTYFTAKPTWQTGPGVPNDSARDVPDLSLNSSPAHDQLLICLQGSCVNGFRDVTTDPATNNTLTVVGGTSAASPTFAGIVALINQKHVNTPPGLGNINSVLYSMAQNAPAAFHDITVGNNKVPCQAGSPDCPASGELGYSAGPGYDQASGLGSIDAYNLVMEWNSTATGLPAPALTAPANGAAGVGLSPAFRWSAVSGNNGYRIMIATSPSDLSTHPAITTCSACTAVETTAADSNSYTPASALPAGAYFWQVQAIEPASSSGLAAWSDIFSFSTTGATLPAPTLSTPANEATDVAVTPTFTWTTVSGSAGYRILIAATQSALPTNAAVSTCGGCAVGTTISAASYIPSSTALSGSTTYYWEVQALAPSGSGQSAAWSSISSFTTVAADFSLSASPASLTIAPGSSGTSTLTLTPINNFSGTVAFTCSPASTLAGVTCAVGTLGSNNTATVTITASSSATTFPSSPGNPPWDGWWVVGAAMLCLLLAGFSLRCRPLPPHRWDWRTMAIGAVLTAILLATLSCGSSGGGSNSPPTKSGTVTVTGTSTNITHSTQISVSIS